MSFLARCIVVALSLLASFAALPTAWSQKPGEEIDAFFKEQPIVELNIEIGSKEMDALRREPRKYVRAKLIERVKGMDVVYDGVGVHCKGAAGSFRGIDDKAGLTLNMDKFDNVKLFHGMDKFHLANSLQDPSYISELVCGEMFRAAGVPASRCAHAVVSINGKRRGFYYLKEGYDSTFLRQNFKTRNGNFYDGGFLRDIDQPLQLVSGKENTKPHDDLKKLLAAARSDPKQRFAQLEKVLEMDKFISFLALEVMCWDWDGYPINRNNYRMYHDPTTDKFTFIPSGMDQMFHDPNGPLFPGFNGEVARAVMATTEGKQRYVKRVEELIPLTIRSEKTMKRLDELQAKVQPALAAVDAGAGRDYPNQVNRLRSGMQQRAKRLEEELKKLKK